MSWDIVFWANKETVDYVPSVWALPDGTSYKWPTGIPVNLKQKLIETCNTLGTVKFRICKGIAKKKGITSLCEAQKYCEKASYTSSLETTDAEEFHHHIEGHNLSSADDELPLQQLITGPIRDYGKSLNKSSSDPSLPNDPIYVLPAKVRTRITTTSYSSPRIGYAETDEQSSSAPSCSSPRSVENTDSNPAQISQLQVSMTEAEKLIYKGIMALKWEILDMKRQVNRRLNQLEEHMILTGNMVSYNGSTENEMAVSYQLPLQDEESLESTELSITADQKKFDILVECLYLSGGDTAHKAIYSSMNKLFAKELAMRYSGEGKKGKLSFQKLKCHEAVIRAVRKRFKDATDKEINKSISAFLAGANDRQGGRRAREKNYTE